MDYAQARQYLDALSVRGMDFGLARMERLLDTLGHPEHRFRVIHVAGTNGKGSTCAFIDSILRTAGFRVGLYTSPHLVRPSERIRVDGVEIPDEPFTRGVEQVIAAAGELALTYFEFETALALVHFAASGIDVAVLETGLGGRLDATNAVASRLAVITRIGLDHTALLGDSLEAIAGEKAGIFKPGAPVVLSRQPPEALAVLRRGALENGAGLTIAGEDFVLEPHRELGLIGPYQRENAEAAVAAVHRFESMISDATIDEGLRRTRWPGRMELVATSPRILLDGAHNPDGARALAEALAQYDPDARIQLVLGVLADKDYRGIVARLFPLAERIHLVSPLNERALERAALEALLAGRPGVSYVTLEEALDAARSAARASGERGLVVIAGSLYLVGEARGLLIPPAPR